MTGPFLYVCWCWRFRMFNYDRIRNYERSYVLKHSNRMYVRMYLGGRYGQHDAIRLLVATLA